jgi:hypothetical protein
MQIGLTITFEIGGKLDANDSVYLKNGCTK